MTQSEIKDRPSFAEPDPTEEFYYEYDEPNEVESDPNIKWSEYLFGINGKQAS